MRKVLAIVFTLSLEASHSARSTSASSGQGSVGFGSARSRQPKSTAHTLGPKALDCLQRAKGNLDLAQSLYLTDAAKAVHAQDPDAFARLVAFKQSGGAAPDVAAQELLVKLTWDSVAAFLEPHSAAPSVAIDEKMHRIASAAAVCASDGSLQVLDVGCGDGALVGYLRAAAPSAGYLGVDLSDVMIDRARQAHPPPARFEQGAFTTAPSCRPPAAYSCVLFSGSLQFVQDQAGALRQAASLLSAGGRIVICHALGAAFVEQEHAANRMVAVSQLPSRAELETLGAQLGLRLVEDDLSAQTGGREFYLCSLCAAQ